jgi:hypothetical protein
MEVLWLFLRWESILGLGFNLISGEKRLFLKKLVEMTLSSGAKTQEIPSYLIYEMDDGRPIYYKGYREVLETNGGADSVSCQNNLQAWIKSEISFTIKSSLVREYILTTGNLGLQIARETIRVADIAIFTKENFVLSNHYSSKAPEIAIEIDTKADLDSPGASIDYFDRKNRQLLEFGVKKIIWIFTEVHSIKVLVPGEDVQHFEWEEDITVMEGVQFNLQKIMDQLL